MAESDNNKPTHDERRRFERLQLAEDAVALNAEGKELGRVSQAGGGGFLIYPANPDAIRQLAVGNRLTITVTEPRSKASNHIYVEVRYRKGAAMGVQFITGRTSPT
jgi:hypothetical protein